MHRDRSMGTFLRWMVLVAAVSFVVVAPRAVSAQFVESGIRLGTGATQFTGDGVRDMESRASWLAGGSMSVMPLGFVGVGLDLLYLPKGATGRVGSQSLDATLHTLHIPVYARVQLPLPIVKPEVQLGGYFDWHMSRRIEGGSWSVEANDLFRSTDVGLMAGVGLTLDLVLVKPSLFFRGTWGARTLLEPIEVGGARIEGDVRHRAFFAIAGLDF